MPISEDAITANISNKDNKVEDFCISDIVFAVKGFFIKSSRFSYSLGEIFYSYIFLIVHVKEFLSFIENSRKSRIR